MRGVTLHPYPGGHLVAFDTRQPEAAEAIRAMLGRLAGDTPLKVAQRTVRSLESHLATHQALDVMDAKYGRASRSFTASVAAKLEAARIVLGDLMLEERR